MSRTGHVALIALMSTCAALAAPAPPRPWMDGWKVVDPDKSSTFERKGGVLTITLHSKKEKTDRQPTPCLLREVSGNFVAEVRLGGSFLPSEAPKEGGYHSSVTAGLVLMGEKHPLARVCRSTNREGKETKTLVYVAHVLENENFRKWYQIAVSEWTHDRPMYLRLSRAGTDLFAAYSRDGKKWEELRLENPPLPTNLKIGVIASSTSKEPFKPRFDKFKLTQKGK